MREADCPGWRGSHGARLTAPGTNAPGVELQL